MCSKYCNHHDCSQVELAQQQLPYQLGGHHLCFSTLFAGLLINFQDLDPNKQRLATFIATTFHYSSCRVAERIDMSSYSVYGKSRSPWREPEMQQIGEAITATLACGPCFHCSNLWDVCVAEPRRRGSTDEAQRSPEEAVKHEYAHSGRTSL